MKHTEGPWQHHASHIYGPDPQRKLIAQVLSGDGRLVADRDILTAAFDMLSALEQSVPYVETLHSLMIANGCKTAATAALMRNITASRAAIAKARGGE